jgi:hypothetical protein
VVYYDAMAREDAQLKIRLAEDLKEAIEAVAMANGRTINAEVVARLEASFEPTEREKDLRAQLDSANDAVAAYKASASSNRMVMGVLTAFLSSCARQLQDLGGDASTARTALALVDKLQAAPEKTIRDLAKIIVKSTGDTLFDELAASLRGETL